jgi:hypothetical protein
MIYFHDRRSGAPSGGVWLAQILLAIFYCGLGGAKVVMPIHDLALWVPWTVDHPVLARLTGLLDFIGGFGVLAPSLLFRDTRITLLAALGLSVLQLFAIGFHVVRLEPSYLPLNLVALSASLFVLCARR